MIRLIFLILFSLSLFAQDIWIRQPASAYGNKQKQGYTKAETRNAIGDSGAVYRAEWASDISDSLNITLSAKDTTTLKTMHFDSTGRMVFLEGLIDGNSRGCGWYAQVDSAYIEMGGTAYSHPTQGKQWVSNSFLETGITNPVDFGVIGDSTATKAVTYANNRRINAAIDFAYTTDKKIVEFPPGKYVFHPEVDTVYAEPHYGIQFEPGVEIRGSGITSTILYSDSAYGISFYCSDAFATTDWDDRVVKISNFKLVGTRRYGGAGDGTGDFGIYIQKHNHRIKMAQIEDLHVQGFGGIALSVNDVNVVLANNVYVEDNDFTAVNFSHCRDVTVNTFVIDSCLHGMELAAGLRNDSLSMDSTTVFTMNNVIMTNIKKYGLRIYGGNFVGLNNVHISGMKGVSAGGSDHGMWFTPQAVHTLEGFGDISINNCKIDGNGGSKYYGIAFKSSTPAATDSSLGNIKVTNTTITGCRAAGIFIQPFDSSYVEAVEIGPGNTIYNNNTDFVNGLGAMGIVADKVDYISIHNNKIFYNDTSLSAGRMPVYLDSCYSADVIDNDFRDPTGTYEYSIYFRDGYYPTAYNNRGCNIDGGLVKFTAPSTYALYYQQSLTTFDGTYISGGLSETALLYTMIADTACTVFYNTSGAAVDTIRVHPVRP